MSILAFYINNFGAD